jgi:ADP-ribosyl-[dinitrogen reductase] hydrolase
VGQIAGATYGAVGIPAAWLDRLHLAQEIAGFADSLWRSQQQVLVATPD